ncbi:MAG: hypothetical protein MUF34_29525, partial [Polyangiaceae bacterium]|nr:hypothetical protein [Polyangiaceae bacterium]
RQEATTLLEAAARAEGEPIAVSSYDDPEGSGSTHVEGPAWVFYFSYDHADRVSGRMGRWRRSPSGLDDGVAWLAARVAEYGPPARVALLAPIESSGAHAVLEWPEATLPTEVTLHCVKNNWTVREDRTPAYGPRQGGKPIGPYRVSLDRLRRRLEHHVTAPTRTSAWPFLERTETWASERAVALERLEAIVPNVHVYDLFDNLETATGLLARLDQGLPACTGAFLIMRSPDAATLTRLRSRLWQITSATGLRSKQLTQQLPFTHEPSTHEPLPEPPTDQVDWLESPFAPTLLREQVLPKFFRGQRFQIVPASFVTVPGALAEWLSLPPASASPASRKYAATTRRLAPLRLRHPESGRSVYLNVGDQEEMLRFAHALLSGLIAARR